MKKENNYISTDMNHKKLIVGVVIIHVCFMLIGASGIISTLKEKNGLKLIIDPYIPAVSRNMEAEITDEFDNRDIIDYLQPGDCLVRNNTKVLPARLYGKKETEQCKMASTTKIMTAIVVIENVKDLSQKVTISKKSAGTGGSRLGLSTNDTITVDNLLYGLMMCSGNDAAVALAEFVGNSVENFSNLMLSLIHI